MHPDSNLALALTAVFLPSARTELRGKAMLFIDSIPSSMALVPLSSMDKLLTPRVRVYLYMPFRV